MTETKTYTTAVGFRRALEERLKKTSQTEQTDINRLRRQVSFDRLLAWLFHDGSDLARASDSNTPAQGALEDHHDLPPGSPPDKGELHPAQVAMTVLISWPIAQTKPASSRASAATTTVGFLPRAIIARSSCDSERRACSVPSMRCRVRSWADGQGSQPFPWQRGRDSDSSMRPR